MASTSNDAAAAQAKVDLQKQVKEKPLVLENVRLHLLFAPIPSGMSSS
jgi:hypothetical protein